VSVSLSARSSRGNSRRCGTAVAVPGRARPTQLVAGGARQTRPRREANLGGFRARPSFPVPPHALRTRRRKRAPIVVPRAVPESPNRPIEPALVRWSLKSSMSRPGIFAKCLKARKGVPQPSLLLRAVSLKTITHFEGNEGRPIAILIAHRKKALKDAAIAFIAENGGGSVSVSPNRGSSPRTEIATARPARLLKLLRPLG
jgi:hypothetical protein